MNSQYCKRCRNNKPLEDFKNNISIFKTCNKCRLNNAIHKGFNTQNRDKIVGLNEDKTKFKVRRKGIPSKTFSFKKCGGKEEAKRRAIEYLLNN